MDYSQDTFTSLEWCAGCAGFSLGLRRVIPTLRAIALSEIEAYACANLVAKMEAGLLDPAPVWTNLKTFPCDEFRDRVDLLVAGYPCQPFSAAGLRQGADDPRHLWPFILDGIRRIRPRLCFFENVEGHISLGLSTVIDDLEAAGYRATWGIFSAAEIGASHQRKRVFILGQMINPASTGELSVQQSGQRGCLESSSGVLADAEHGLLAERTRDARRREPERTAKWGRLAEHCAHLADASDAGSPCAGLEPQHGEQKRFAGDDGGETSAQLADGEQPGLEGQSGHGHGTPGRQGPDRSTGAGRVPLPDSPPRPGDFDAWKSVLAVAPHLEPAICRVADGTANRVDRLRLLGNGVLPGVVAKAFVTLFNELNPA